jgi:hypothetical protein
LSEVSAIGVLIFFLGLITGGLLVNLYGVYFGTKSKKYIENIERIYQLVENSRDIIYYMESLFIEAD